ncbi:MAG: hypothetical protein ACM336_05795 [Acidobacteriota bacterium]
MRFLKLAVPGTVLIVGFAVSTSVSYGKPEYSKKEKKTCTYCHVKMGSKDLNAAGQYYKDHNHSLEGYQAK